MSGINEVIAETQAEELKAKEADDMMVKTMFAILKARYKLEKMNGWEIEQMKDMANILIKFNSPYAKRILEILK